MTANTRSLMQSMVNLALCAVMGVERSSFVGQACSQDITGTPPILGVLSLRTVGSARDIGLFRPGGQLPQVIDRKKNVLKLSQGEYVAVEKVENVLGKCAYISQIFVYGVSTEDSLVGVVVPDVSMLASAPSQNLAELKAFLLAKLNETGRENGLHGFEIVKNIHVEREIEEWTPLNNFLTPTFKLKRAIFKKALPKCVE